MINKKYKTFILFVTSVISLGVWMIFDKTSLIPIRQSTFLCNDPSIRHPYFGGEQIITTSHVIMLWAAITLPLVILCELLNLFFSSSCLWSVLDNAFQTTTVAASMATVSEGVKNVVARLRPHFIGVCKPNLTMDMCFEALTDGTRSVEIARHVPISDFTCTNPDTDEVRQAQKSFFSGHACFSFYFATYLSLYVEVRMSEACLSTNSPIKKMTLMTMKRVIHVILAVTAIFVSLTRYMDNLHYLSDIFAGMAFGLIVGYLHFSVTLKSRFETLNQSSLTIDDGVGHDGSGCVPACYGEKGGSGRNYTSDVYLANLSSVR